MAESESRHSNQKDPLSPIVNPKYWKPVQDNLTISAGFPYTLYPSGLKRHSVSDFCDFYCRFGLEP